MADGEAVGGQVLGASSSLLGIIPFAGPILSAAATIGAGALEQDAAKKQQQQAANLRQQGQNLQVEKLNPFLRSKLTADQLAAQGNMPGLKTAQDMLQQNMANHLRAIQQSSPSGASAVQAMSLALQQQNNATNKLGIQNADYKAGLQKEARQDLWDIGLQQRGLELYRNQERDKMFGQANNLEAASTANKQTGWNTVLGAIGSTGSNIFKNLSDPNYQQALAYSRAAPAIPANGTDARGFGINVNPFNNSGVTPGVDAKFSQPTQSWATGAGNYGGTFQLPF